MRKSIKYGENGKGIHSRWYPQTLKKRIQHIAQVRERITFRQIDAFDLIREYAGRSDAAIFLDPPYTASKKKAGARLYTHYALDHRALFEAAASCQGDVLMTYDNADEIHALADEFGFMKRLIAMKNNHHAAMTELIIGKDLSWLLAG